MLFGFRKKKVISYDKEKCEPVQWRSICKDERVAGFRDLETGEFKEYQLIHSDRELKEFMEACGIDSIKTIY